MEDYDLGWRIWNEVSSQFIQRHKHELKEPLSRKEQDELAVQLGRQLLHDQGFFTVIYGGTVGLLILIGGFFMVNNLTVLYQFLALMSVLYVPVIWLNLASERKTAPMMLKFFRRHYLLQLKKQSVLSKISESFIHQYFKGLDDAEFKRLKYKLCFSLKLDSQKFSAVYFLVLTIFIISGGSMINGSYPVMASFFLMSMMLYVPVFFMGKLINQRMGAFILNFFKNRYLGVLNYDFNQQRQEH